MVLPRWLQAEAPPATPAVTFSEVYESQVDFVWRVARRLGVADAALDDCVQDVFVVVHARLAGFEGRSSLRTWVYGITRRVARDHRPSRREAPLDDTDALPAAGATAHEQLERTERVRLLQRLLDGLDEGSREVFILSELEEVPMPEVAAALGINVNTGYARLRAARRDLEASLARHRAQHVGRLP
jgi:RNA polymerase sigma-70 factor (ECF subfamily)